MSNQQFLRNAYLRERTVSLLAEAFGPIAELFVDDAVSRAGLGSEGMHTSARYLRFLGALREEIPGNAAARRDICEGLWHRVGDDFVN